MTLFRRFVTVFAAAASLAMAAAMFSSGASAQTGNWLVIRADYGFRAQRKDVTGIVKDLISRGGVNGWVVVNNQMMGGDPAPGADKVLRIYARNGSGQDQEFDYAEGRLVPANMFFARSADRDNHADHDDHADRGDRDDRDDHGGRDQFAGGHDRDWNQVNIQLAFWGAQGRMANVTDTLQHMVRNGALTVVANNASIGMDPAPGANKLLIVVYQYHGQQQAAAASEGHMLSLP
jgi:DnaJ-like protein C11, C-terminal